jgi:hypothetical protein
LHEAGQDDSKFVSLTHIGQNPSLYNDHKGRSRFLFEEGKAFRTAAPKNGIVRGYGNQQVAQRLIDEQILDHSCVMFLTPGWSWRCGFRRIGWSASFI